MEGSLAEWPTYYSIFYLGAGCLLLLLGYSLGRWRYTQRDSRPLAGFGNDAAILKLVVEHAHEGLVLQDVHGRIEWSNPAYSRITGYSADEIRGRRPQEFILTPENQLAPETIENFKFDLTKFPSGFKELIQNRRKNGEYFWNQLTFAVVEGDKPENTKMIIICQDVTSQVEHMKELEDARIRLKHQAEHDDLTGAANRTRLSAYLQERLSAASTGGGQIGVIHVDLDHFKDINDSHGHSAGDAVLRHAANVLTTALKDRGLVARIGGDEFIGIVAEPEGVEQMEALGQRILEGLTRPVIVDRQTLSVAGSVGLVLADGAKTSASELIHRADIALYAAKRAGRSRVSWYTDALGTAHRHKRMTMAKLDRDLDNGDLTLLMQPVFDLEQQQIVEYEVSAHWLHPSEGLIDPVQMLSQQEDVKRVARVERFTLERGFAEVKRLREASNIPFALSVNLTAASLKDPRLPDVLNQLRRDTKIEAHDLVLEMDEKIIRFDEPDGLLGPVDHLAAQGCRIALDKFGGGHGGAGQLIHMNAHVLKISPDLIAGLESEPNRRMLVQSVIKLAGNFGLKVVAVGVERPEQVELLKSFGCNLIQGPLVAEPLSPREAENHMREYGLQTEMC